jgi:hypothetical protein
MKTADILGALDLPKAALVGQRVPKRLLLENGAPTSSDKRRINEGVEELVWLAALKPTTVGVPEYRDDVREYLEISVLRLTLRAEAKTGRLLELVHRAVPYPVLLIAEQERQTSISAVHKRWSEGEAGKTVLDGDLVTTLANPPEASDVDADLWRAFSQALALRRQPRTTLLALYQGWIDTLLALEAAWIIGKFVPATSAAEGSARRDALCEHRRLEAEIVRLRALADREVQMPRQVELNLEVKRLEAEMVTLKGKLSSGISK